MTMIGKLKRDHVTGKLRRNDVTGQLVRQQALSFYLYRSSYYFSGRPGNVDAVSGGYVNGNVTLSVPTAGVTMTPIILPEATFLPSNGFDYVITVAPTLSGSSARFFKFAITDQCDPTNTGESTEVALLPYQNFTMHCPAQTLVYFPGTGSAITISYDAVDITLSPREASIDYYGTSVTHSTIGGGSETPVSGRLHFLDDRWSLTFTGGFYALPSGMILMGMSPIGAYPNGYSVE